MSIFISEVDVQRGITAPAVPSDYAALWLLVRAGRQPLGLVRLARPPSGWDSLGDSLASVLETQMGPRLRPAEVPAAGPPSVPAVPISVVVCTRDRAESLQCCLAALSRMDYPEYEVVVVDNAPSDETTRAVVAATPFGYVRETRPGLDWARNRGAAEARHAVVAYTDDDVQVDEAWLWGVAAAFAEPRVAAMTGLVLPSELETAPQILFERYGGMSKGFKARTLNRRQLGDAGTIGAHQCGVGANMAFRRATLEQLGGFDTALDVGTPSGGGGDLDMFHRVLASGRDLRYEPAAMVWHQHRRDQSGLSRQLYNNGRSFGVYLGKIWRDRTVPRPATARYAAEWVSGWLLWRLFDRLRGRLDMPLELVWAEVRGMLTSPFAFRATHQSDAALRGRGGQKDESLM